MMGPRKRLAMVIGLQTEEILCSLVSRTCNVICCSVANWPWCLLRSTVYWLENGGLEGGPAERVLKVGTCYAPNLTQHAER